MARSTSSIRACARRADVDIFTTVRVEAMGAMALLPICDSSFTCENYNTYRAHPCRHLHPGPLQLPVYTVKAGLEGLVTCCLSRLSKGS